MKQKRGAGRGQAIGTHYPDNPIAAARIAAGLSQAEVARRAEMPQSTVARLERRGTFTPSMRTRATWAKLQRALPTLPRLGSADWGDRVRAVTAAHGLTLDALFTAAGIPETSFYRYLRGTYPVPARVQRALIAALPALKGTFENE